MAIGADGKGYKDYESIIKEKLNFRFSWDRVFADLRCYSNWNAIKSSIHEITRIDMWFLKQYEELFRNRKRDFFFYRLKLLQREFIT